MVFLQGVTGTDRQISVQKPRTALLFDPRMERCERRLCCTRFAHRWSAFPASPPCGGGGAPRGAVERLPALLARAETGACAQLTQRLCTWPTGHIQLLSAYEQRFSMRTRR